MSPLTRLSPRVLLSRAPGDLGPGPPRDARGAPSAGLIRSRSGSHRCPAMSSQWSAIGGHAERRDKGRAIWESPKICILVPQKLCFSCFIVICHAFVQSTSWKHPEPAGAALLSLAPRRCARAFCTVTAAGLWRATVWPLVFSSRFLVGVA